MSDKPEWVCGTLMFLVIVGLVLAQLSTATANDALQIKVNDLSLKVNDLSLQVEEYQTDYQIEVYKYKSEQIISSIYKQQNKDLVDTINQLCKPPK